MALNTHKVIGDLVSNLMNLVASQPGTVQVDVIDTWPVYVQAVATAVTAAGVITAGLWALLRFKRGRTFMERCSIDLDCAVANVDGKMAILVNVVVKNCGDSRVTFKTTDPAGIEISSISNEDWRGLQDCHWVQWQKEENVDDGPGVWENDDWHVREDLLEDCGGRYETVSLEPGQDLSRSCLFIMPKEWAAARIRCVLAPTTNQSYGPRWIATRVVTKSDHNETAHTPVMGRVLRDKVARK
jgi:hypothetical protein